MSTSRLLGRGWSFPVLPDERGALPLAEGPEKVAQAIRLVLDTEPGERLMRPEFGCGLRRFLMKPNSAAVRTLIRSAVEAALTRWEPRIALQLVAVDSGEDPALIYIRISYVHLRTRQPGSLVYPFYLQR
jgi:phage baseplate assembly protein W